MATNFPGSADDFATTSPTNLGDDDSTGRTHAERHNDMESAMEAVQTLGRSVVPNLIGNPAFEIWQRGTTTTTCTATARTFLADRWFVLPEGANCTQERSATVPTGSATRYSLRVDGAASVTTVDVAQRVAAADVPPLARTITFAWQVYNGTGASLTPSLRIGTPGAADDFTTVTNRLAQTLQACADAAWTTVTHTVDISAYTDLANGIEIALRFPSGSVVASDYVLIAEAQATATPARVAFTRPGVAAELHDCLRYAWVCETWAGLGDSTVAIAVMAPFPVQMVKAPGGAAFGAGTIYWRVGGADASDASYSVDNVSATRDGAWFQFGSLTGISLHRPYQSRQSSAAPVVIFTTE